MEDISRDSLLLNWAFNTYSNRENNDVLLLFCESTYNNMLHSYLDTLKGDFYCQISKIRQRSYLYKYEPNGLKSILINEKNNIAENFIFLVDKNSISEIKLLIDFFSDKRHKILYALEEDAMQAFNKIHSEKFKDIETIGFPEHLNYYLNGFDTTEQGLISLLKNNELYQYLNDFIRYRIDFIERFYHQHFYLDKQITAKMEKDIELLRETNLLTSNLAMHIYRLYFFKPEASATETGRYFRENLGIGSNTYSPKSKKFNNIQNRPLNNFKAYDLSINMEKQIKLDIASKIVRHIKSNAGQGLDRHSIASITSLSIQEVDEIYDSYQRSKKSI